MNCPYRQERDGIVCTKFDNVPESLKNYPHFMNRVCNLCPDGYYNRRDKLKQMEDEIKRLPLMENDLD